MNAEKLAQTGTSAHDRYVISKVEDWTDSFGISTKNGTCFSIKKKYGVTPQVGDVVDLYGGFGGLINGIDLNGVELFYHDKARMDANRALELAQMQVNKLKKFDESKNQLDADYESLPVVLQTRIDRMRHNNPNFRVDYEAYEMFVSTQAVVVKDVLRQYMVDNNASVFEALTWFRGMTSESQTSYGLSSEHSGNTFGKAMLLARALIEAPIEYIEVKDHAGMAAMLGCTEVGCHTDADFA